MEFSRLAGLTAAKKTWGFGLCFLYLRNVKGYGWNHKRDYRIYCELELNLRIKPRKRLKSNGAARLGVSPANLSVTITSLEKYLGAQLFKHTPYGLRATIMALRLRDFAVAITMDLEQSFLDLKAGRIGDTSPSPVISYAVPNGSVTDWAIMRGMQASIPRGGAKSIRLASEQTERQ